jgi:quercetin dioxygenase-like cupin family protein
MMIKFDALKETNEKLIGVINEYKNTINNENIIYSNINKNDILYKKHNDETSIFLWKIKKNQLYGNMIENEFKRIVCVKGNITINLLCSGETIDLISPDTILIEPNVEHDIISNIDSELIIIFKPQKEDL